MITLDNLATQAAQKLDNERSAVKGQKELAMAGPVAAAIKDFCVQNEGFAKAVVAGGSFAKCMKSVAEGTGNYISDLDAYKKAVQFYFPSAEVRMQMTIELAGSDTDAEPADNGIVLNLEDLL